MSLSQIKVKAAFIVMCTLGPIVINVNINKTEKIIIDSNNKRLTWARINMHIHFIALIYLEFFVDKHFLLMENKRIFTK